LIDCGAFGVVLRAGLRAAFFADFFTDLFALAIGVLNL
jgi:hypothetical protein